MTMLKNSLLFIILIAADLVTKYIAVSMLPLFGWWLIPDYGFLTTTNRGVAFGWWADNAVLLPVLLIILLLIFWLYFYRTNFSYQSKMAITMILAGGISNLIDRLLDGTITDFIVLKFWPTSFNLADIFITVGVFYLLIEQFRKTKIQLRQKPSS